MKYYFYKPGSVPGFPGFFPANSIVEIDDATNALLSVLPIFPDGAPQPAPNAVQAIETPDFAAVEKPQPAVSTPQPAPQPAPDAAPTRYSNGG